jgi:glycosyltransferase involved in cell wall biosynthesis
MKILMLAPEPFFQPRGTPISIYFRIKALSDLGHRTNLVTYPLGEDVEFRNFTISRVPNLLRIRKIKIGPSFIKLPLDIGLLIRAIWELAKGRPDVIFSHEEAGWFGAALGKISGTPHIYDMHSSLPQQLENFHFSKSKLLIKIFLELERFVLKNSKAVIVICRDLLEYVQKKGYGEKAVFLENFIDFNDFEEQPLPTDLINKKKSEVAPRGEKIVLYAGNFEPYQGIPLLIEAFTRVKSAAVLLVVGGSKSEHDEMRKKANGLGLGKRLVFVEKVPPQQVVLYIALCDVLISPRVSGTNTPLKIYSFLKSGKPLVATRLWTHTQILDDRLAVLTAPEPQALADGISFALDSEEARVRAREARRLAEREYVYPKYLEKISEALQKAAGRISVAKN